MPENFGGRQVDPEPKRMDADDKGLDKFALLKSDVADWGVAVEATEGSHRPRLTPPGHTDENAASSR
jgi:hypothetical protein